jgi:hypothetical protein
MWWSGIWIGGQKSERNRKREKGGSSMSMFYVCLREQVMWKLFPIFAVQGVGVRRRPVASIFDEIPSIELVTLDRECLM